ncbi:MAG: hypothetical protein CML68_13435 [Rhodobacteraceae bacterium]|nr:hypothetical protein [Paracoccaceae bacterium]
MTFETELLASLGDADDAWDINITTRQCIFFDFDGYPIRIWDGMGKLIAGGYEWIGALNAAGESAVSIPPLRDTRDGSNLRYEFGLPFLDEDTFDALKADQDLARGRGVTVYEVLVNEGEGLRPGTDLHYDTGLKMRGAQFYSGYQQISDGEFVRVYSASVIARVLDAGRSVAPRGTYSDTCQNERAVIAGESSDSGCVFVSENVNRTYVFD